MLAKTTRLVGSFVFALAVLWRVALSPATAQETNSAKILDAKSGFEMLTQLSGNWEGIASRSDGKEVSSGPKRTLAIKVTSNESLVTVRFYPDTPLEMISVFYMDGEDDLIHTHYCYLQNQPMMRFEKSSKPAELKFTFAGGTNLNPEIDRHDHNMTLRFITKDRFELVAEDWDEGKSTGEVTTVYRPAD